jgi:hypothetical protein
MSVSIFMCIINQICSVIIPEITNAERHFMNIDCEKYDTYKLSIVYHYIV